MYFMIILLNNNYYCCLIFFLIQLTSKFLDFKKQNIITNHVFSCKRQQIRIIKSFHVILILKKQQKAINMPNISYSFYTKIYLIFYLMMNQVCQLRLISQDATIKSLFLAKMFKRYGSESNHPPQGLSVDLMTEEQFCQMIGKFSNQQLSNWKITIQGYQFSFLCDIDKHLASPESITFLLKVGEQIHDSTIDLLKRYYSDTLNLLIVVNKPWKYTRQKTIMSYKDEIFDILHESNIETKQDSIIEICLKENVNVTQGPLVQKMIQIAQLAKQSRQRSRIDNLKLAKDLSQIYKCLESGQQIVKNQSNDLRQKVKNSLQLLLNKFTTLDLEQCLQYLLDKNIDDGVRMIKRNEREIFKAALQQCTEYQSFLHPQPQIPLLSTKDMAISSLNIIATKYNISQRQDCFFQILGNKFDDASFFVARNERKNFLKDLNECKELLEYFKIIFPPVPTDPKIQIRTLAQKAAMNLLTNYKIVDAEECLKVLLEGKLDQVLLQIPRSRRPNFTKDYQDCQPLQKYLSFIDTPKQKNLKQQAKNAILIILNKFKVKQIQVSIEGILNNNLDDVILEVRRVDRQSFKKDIQSCLELKQFLNSINNVDPVAVIKKQAEVQMIQLLQKYGVVDIDQILPDLINGNIDNVILELPKRKRQPFKNDFTVCQKIKKYLQFINKSQKSNQQYQKDKVIEKISNIAKRYGVIDIKQCLNDLFEFGIEQSGLHVSKLKRADYINEVKSCKQLYNFLNPHQQQTINQQKSAQNYVQVIDKSQKQNRQNQKNKVIQKITNIAKKYGVENIKQCLNDLFEHGIEASGYNVRKSKRVDYTNEVKTCKQLYNFIKSPEESNIKQEKNVQIFRQNALNILRQLLKTYDLKKSQQCLEELMKNNFQDARFFIKRTEKQRFQKQILQCKQYQIFLNPSFKIQQNPNGSSQRLQQLASLALYRILIRYDVQGDKDQVISEIFVKNFQNIQFWVKRDFRTDLKREIKKCSELIQYWKYIQPINQMSSLRLRENAEKSLTKLLYPFNILKLKQCIQNILNNNPKDAQSQVNPKKRVQFSQTLLKCQQLQKYLAHCKPKKGNYQQKAKQSLAQICEQFDIQEIDQCVKQIMQGNLKEVLPIVRRAQRVIFEKKVSQCKQFIQFLNSKKPLSSQKLLQQAKLSLSVILKKYGIDQVDQCLIEIFKGNLQTVKTYARRNDRQKFISQILSCIQYQKYSKSIVIKDESMIIKQQAQKSLRQLLTKYVREVDYCLQLILNNNVQTVLTEQIRENKKIQFIKQLQNLKQYRKYLQLTGVNHKVKSNIKNILTNKGIKQNLLTHIINDIIQGKFTQLKKAVKSEQYYLIIGQIAQNNQFFNFLKQNQQKFIGNISYLYYFKKTIPQLEDIINSITSPNIQSTAINNKTLWLQVFLKSQRQTKVEILEKEIIMLNDILTNVKDQKSYNLCLLLQSTLRVNFIKQSKQIQDCLNQISRSCKINLAQVQNKLTQLEKNINFVKDIVLKEESQKQIKKYKHIIKLNDFRKMIFAKLSITSPIQLAINFSRQLIKQDYQWDSTIEKTSKQAEKVRRLIDSNNFIDYIKEKVLQLKLLTYSIFYTLNNNIINSMMVPMEFEQLKTKILLQNQVKSSYICQLVAKTLKKDYNELLIQLAYQNENKFINNDDSIVQKPIKISVYKKISTHLLFRDKRFKFNISKSISFQSLIIIAIDKLKEQKIYLQKQNILLFAMLEQSSNFIEIKESIEHLQMKNNGLLKFIRVKQNIPVTIYYQTQSFQYVLQSDKNINDIKQLIFEKTKIPIKSQSFLFAFRDKQLEVFNQKLDQIDQNSSSLTFTMISKMNLQHYGFHQNYPLSFQQYSQFFIQKDNDMQNMIDSCTFKKENEKSFFYQLITLLYSAVKRRFPFTYITDQIKKKFAKTAIVIWSGGDFSEYFLIYYILYNSDQKLRIQLMNILRTRVPLPLYYKNFNNINDIKDEWTINQQLLWLTHPGLCITSIGLHTQNVQNEKGKTYLNNLLFYSNFQLSGSKHPISNGCPQILLKALGSVVAVNIIDVPSSTPVEIINKILQVTHVLIIHSWKEKRQSDKYIRQIKQKYNIKHVICFLRDHKNKQETIVKVLNANFQESPFVELHNLQRNLNDKDNQLSFLAQLKDKIWMINNKVNFKDQKNYTIIFRLFNNKLFQQYNIILSKLKNKFYDMKVVFNKYQHIKQLKNDRNANNFQKIQTLKEQTIKCKVASEFEKILLFIDKNSNFSEILMLRLREVLKQIKNQEQKKYNIIAQYKKKLSLLPSNNKQQFQKLVSKAISQIGALPKMKKIQNISIKSTSGETIEELSKVFDFYENDIKSVFFTIQLAWRQIQYLTTLGPEVKLGPTNLLDFIIDTKRKEIANSQPFELLDGDLLQMPKNIVQKVFEGIKDRVAVISIMGPQSSGKSTLLNFLFGCDFGTSEGRCTKGVYGTYFKFSNVLLPNCDGVFLMDTEGLFATVNKKDAARRKDFDSKLVLFCLAVSDFVIINTKGNLDSESSKILKSSLDRFAKLAQENIQKPQIFLILNQNNTSNKQTSEADINKLRQIFKGQNSFSLNQAYELKQITHQDIAMLPKQENLVKKQPKAQFLTLTNQLQQSLMSKIKAKANLQAIGVKIDLMEKIWSTIQAFPELGKSISKKLQDIQSSIKQWKINKLQILSNKKDIIFLQFKQNLIVEKKCQQLFVQNINSLIKQFKDTFLSQKQLKEMESEQKIRIELQEQKIQLAFQAYKYELTSKIKDLQKDRLAEKCKIQGGEYQKEAIRKVRKLQRDQKRELSKQEKQQYFNKAFQLSLDKIQLISAPKQQLENYFERTFQFYSNAANVTNVNNAGLPKPQWKYENNMNYSQFANKIKSLIFKEMGTQSNRYIQFRQNPPTRILNESSKTDAKLEYFNMRNYFQKKKVVTYYEISTQILKKCLKIDLLKSQMSAKFERKNTFDSPLSQIFTKINKLFALYGFGLESFQNFKKRFEYQSQFFTLFTPQPILVVKILQQSNSSYKRNTQKRNSSKNTNIPQVSRQGVNYNQNYAYPTSYDRYGRNNYINTNQIKARNNEMQQQFRQEQEQRQKLTEQKFLQQIREFISMSTLEQKIKKVNNSNMYQSSTFLSNCLKDIIKWSNIKSKIQKSTQYDSIKKIINFEVNQALNNDLNHFGVSISCSDYYQCICKAKYINMEFKSIRQIKSFEKQKDFFQKFKNLRKFDQNKIRYHLKKSYTKLPQSNLLLQIGSYYQQTFEVLKEYRNTKELLTYMSNEHNQVYYNLKSYNMKQFVYNELVNKKTISKLFSNIDSIINKPPDYLTLSTVTSIYIDVNKQIIQFNNDLNQVSHKLTLLFTGYVHLYAIYLTWKKFSEAALKQANKPYFSMLDTRKDKLNFFLKQTSNDDNQKSQGESDRLLNEVLAFFKQIIFDNKEKINENEAKKFKKDYPRKIIQQKIDRQCFDVSSKQEDWIKYLTDPAKVIEQKYESLTKDSVSRLKIQYQRCQRVTELLQQFKQVLKLLLQKLKSVKLTQDTLHTDLFSIHKKTQKEIAVTDSEVLEVINGLIMTYFLNLLVGDQQKIYISIDFNLEINKEYSDIKIIRGPTPNLQRLISKLIGQKMSITRLYTFVEMVNKKLHQKENINGVQVQKFSTKIKNLMTVTPDDQNKFRSLVTVKICKELCPGCQRICGVQEVHTNKHECRYGHQMRALGKVKLNNDEASVIRCEDVQLTSQIQFNGRKMIWKQFKQQWENRAEGSWTFDDLLKKDTNKQLFQKAWDITGRVICHMFGMKFVEANAVEIQKKASLVQPTHYIFSLDDSGSMSGKPWQDLMSALNTAMNTIINIPQSQHFVKISILVFNSTCRVYQENVTLKAVKRQVPFQSGGTDFADAFEKAYTVMAKYVANSKIKFIFMTDGGDSYPSTQVDKINALKKQYPNKIQYNGIQFGGSNDTMKLICKQLAGTNSISYSAAQLTSAYVEIISRK